MGDLAEAVEDLICLFDGTGDTTMDTLAMLLFGWALLALFVLWLGRLAYARFFATKKSGTTSGSVAAVGGVTAAAATTDVADARKRTATVTAKGAPASGGYVPPTPPVRRRLTRQSPTPEVTKRTRYVPAPQCTGPDNVTVLWVNDVLQWLYNDLVIVNELLNVWIQALNEYMKKSVNDGVGVELVRILPETNPPSLSNIFAECDTKDDVTITCDCDSTPAFQLKSSRQKGEQVETSHYRVNINRFRARLNIYCITEKLLTNIKCDGWPDIKIALAPVGNIKNNLDETQLQEVISEILANALRHTEVDLNLAQYPTCPKLVRHISMPGQILPLHYDGMSQPYTSTPTRTNQTIIASGDKRLLVKVVRAQNLGSTYGCTEPYCVVEMDEPSQKNQTSIKKSTDSPYWDEHFLFDLSPNTAEILFEIYDHAVRPQHKFLGLGIVGVEELLINPSQRQIISLQSRPYESDPVSGTLTVEFSFIEGADIPNVGGGQPYKIKETIRTPSPSSPNRARPFTNSPVYHNNDGYMNGNHFATNTLDPDINRSNSYSNRNPLIIQGVQRQPSQRLVKVQLSTDGEWKEIERIEKTVVEEIDTYDVQNTKDNNNEKESNENTNSELIDDGKIITNIEDDTRKNNEYTNFQSQNQNTQGDFRGRPRKRRDFFGTIKRRLGKSRSKSVGGMENDIDIRDDSVNRSISADRNRNGNYRLSVPGQRSMDETSRRSSMSEASGLSSASTRTYINEASTLVLETLENGVKKHYLVPLSLAQKSKWKKKGTKLHIFNDHTFIARHLTGGTTCQVCGKSIARRIGKQGYECRDCLLKCHKHCHVKVNDNCPTSTIHNIELSYITNPYTDKNLSIL